MSKTNAAARMYTFLETGRLTFVGMDLPRDEFEGMNPEWRYVGDLGLIETQPTEVPFVDSYGFEVLLGDRMYIDSSQHYRNGTAVLTIKRKPREIAAAPTESK